METIKATLPFNGVAPAEILHVEDESMFARALASLMPRQFRLVTVETLFGAEDILSARTVEACILDLNLPDSTGVATLRRIRERTPAPVVVVTGVDDDQLAVKAFRLGAVGFFTKMELMSPGGRLRLIEVLDRHILRFHCACGAKELRHLSESVYQRVLAASGPA